MVDQSVHRAPLLVFVHIPKTAGTTLRAVLSMNEPGPRTRALGNVFKGGGGISKTPIARLRDGKGPDLTNARLVRGHSPLGIREYLPRYLPQGRELRCFTFLREPVDRTLSHYFAIRAAGRGYGLPPLQADATLGDALEGGYLHDNLQTRMLSGLPEPFGEVDDAMLEQAKRNLRDGLVLFGLTERFDESLVLAKQRLGLRTILHDSNSRVHTERPRGDEVPADLRRAAERCNRHDIELYSYAEQLFESAPERQQADFEIELAALRAAKTDGDIDLDGAPPKGYNGDMNSWRLLLHARATLLRVERELAGSEGKATTARSRMRGLKRRMEELEAAPARIAELEREVERLEAATSVNHPLPRTSKRPTQKPPRSRPKHEARRRAPKPARARPKPNAKHHHSKPIDTPQAKRRRRGTTAKRTRGNDSG